MREHLTQLGDANEAQWPWHVHRDGELPEKTADWIFVFASNLSGRHGVGDARIAAERFGAVQGVGAGPTGRAVAIPTKGLQLQTLPVEEIAKHAQALIAYAREQSTLRFWITRIGCGPSGGYNDATMSALFANVPPNCSMPMSWAARLHPTGGRGARRRSV